MLFAIVVGLQGCATRSTHIAFRDGFFIVKDPTTYRFRNVGWDYTNITNPLLLTKNRLNHSMIGIQRVKSGKALPRGTNVFRTGMSLDQIRDLVLENLKAKEPTRGADIQIGKTTLAGVEAVSISYRCFWKGQPQYGLEYAFVRNDTLFHLIFLADEGSHLSQMLNDYAQIVKSFAVGQ